MWKILVVICAFGVDCTMFESDPMVYYQTEEECIVAADVKAKAMVQTFTDYGYYVDSAAHSCQYLDHLKAT